MDLVVSLDRYQFRLTIRCQFRTEVTGLFIKSDRPPDDGLSKMSSLAASLGRRVFLDCFGSFADHFDDYVRFGEHWNVAAFYLGHSGSHTL